MENSGNHVVEILKVFTENGATSFAALVVIAFIIYIPYKVCTRKRKGKGGDNDTEIIHRR